MPGLNGFVGEFPILVGAFESSCRAGVLAATGMVLGACYLLWMVRKVLFGPLKEPVPHASPGETISPAATAPYGRFRRLAAHEIAGLAPLMFLIVAIGVYPRPVLEQMRPTLAKIDQNTQVRRAGAVAILRWEDDSRGNRAPSVKRAANNRLSTTGQDAANDVETRKGGSYPVRRIGLKFVNRPGSAAHEGPREALMNSAYSLSVVEQTALVLVPELILLATAIVMMTASAFVVAARSNSGPRSARVRSWRRFVALFSLGRTHTDLYAAVALNDDLSFYARAVLLFSGLILLGMAHREPSDERAGEFFGSFSMMCAGSMIVAAANDIVVLFVGLELVSMPTYVILYLSRRTSITQEAAMKYFFLSIFASGLLLYGLDIPLRDDRGEQPESPRVLFREAAEPAASAARSGGGGVRDGGAVLSRRGGAAAFLCA